MIYELEAGDDGLILFSGLIGIQAMGGRRLTAFLNNLIEIVALANGIEILRQNSIDWDSSHWWEKRNDFAQGIVPCRQD
jgi:hypothetical protein